MTLWQTPACLIMMVLLDSINDVWTLAAPGSVTMTSVDRTHTLTWIPPETPCNTTILYSVQFQGEFELMVLNGSWVDSSDCQRVPRTHCDLTFDLGSDSDYNIRVRAQCGSEASAWSKLSPTFNRRHTVLMVPNMKVEAMGTGLQVSFYELPVAAAAKVTVWKKDDKQQLPVFQESVYSVPVQLQVPGLQEGAKYCVMAQVVLIQRVLSSTEAQCVTILAKDAQWKTPTTVTGTVIIMSGLLFVVFWSIVHCQPHHCRAYFTKEPLPQSLHIEDVQIRMRPEETELCDRVHLVPSNKD
ncbi:cytokine receptor family member B16 [Betta splendens]|uniref:Cytokine receptor family member B16 n=1 Tax=Betta splendens TaxID=158456 RepID=A0A6P7L2B1_BETSP|nr:cytokine receptor family member B16 [Betta splendens]